MPNTHRRRDETVQLRCVVGVNTPVGSRDQFTISCADKWRHNDVFVEKVIKIHEYHSWFERLQTCSVTYYVISYFYSIVCRTVNWVTADGCVHIAESVGSRHELVVNSCTHRRRDATQQFCCVGGVYWAEGIKCVGLHCVTNRDMHQQVNSCYIVIFSCISCT